MAVRRPAASIVRPVMAALLALGAQACANDGAQHTGSYPAPGTHTSGRHRDRVIAGAGPIASSASADIYADPPTAPPGVPGMLLRYQPTGPRSWRVMYVSADREGRPVAVTGYVRIPGGVAPVAGWPVVSWAHGTTGSADVCAPSRATSPLSPADVLIEHGIVEVATDYVGLGGPGLHPYLDGPTEGRATLDILTAAGEIPGLHLGRDLVIWGHSQGGHAALFARQFAATRLAGHRLLGTVAFAPPSGIVGLVSQALRESRTKAFGIMALAGIAAGHPGTDLGRVLTPAARDLALATVDAGCSDSIDRAFVGFGGANVLIADPATAEPWASALASDEPGLESGSGPLLLVHARDDQTVPETMSGVVEFRTCARGETTQRWLYDTGGHAGVITGDPLASAVSWTIDRLAYHRAANGCGTTDRPPR